jgi:hypothetical protein
LAQILGNNSINDIEILQVDSNPASGAGTAAEIGSIAVIVDSSELPYQKFGANDVDWRPLTLRSFVHYENIQTTQNLNTGLVGVQIFENQVEISDDFTLLSNISMQCNFDGFVKASYNLHLTSGSSRVNLRCRFFKNLNTPIGPIGASGYIRDTNGHNESSISGYSIIPVSNGETIQLSAEQEANGGTVTLNSAGTSNIILERY